MNSKNMRSTAGTSSGFIEKKMIMILFGNTPLNERNSDLEENQKVGDMRIVMISLKLEKSAELFVDEWPYIKF